MLISSFSPSGSSEKMDLLRSAIILYLVQITWAVLVFLLLWYFKDENIKHLPAIITSSYFLFLYLYVCAYAKRLRALSYNLLCLIPIGVVFCFMFFLTAMMSVELLTPTAAHYIEKQYLLVGLNTLGFNALAFLGCFLTSVAVAHLPAQKPRVNLSRA